MHRKQRRENLRRVSNAAVRQKKESGKSYPVQASLAS